MGRSQDIGDMDMISMARSVKGGENGKTVKASSIVAPVLEGASCLRKRNKLGGTPDPCLT